MKVSVLIHNLNRAQAVDACLASIAQQTYRPLEVVILDAGSTDNSLDIIKKRSEQLNQAGIEVVFQGCQPAGVAASRNHAVSFASGELLCFIDNDAVLQDSDAVECMARYFAEDASLACLTFKVLLRDTDNLDMACWQFRRPWRVWQNRTFATFTFGGGSCCLRADDFHAAKGYLEALVYSREEEDLAFDLINRGRRILYTPEITIRHYPGAAPTRNMDKRRFHELQNGLWVLWRRLPLPIAVIACLARTISMSLRMAVKKEGNLLHLWRAVGDIMRKWRTEKITRAPVSYAGFSSYIKCNISRTALAGKRHHPVERIDILGCPFDCLSFKQTVAQIREAVSQDRSLHIATGNVDFVIKAKKDATYRATLHKADLVVADGVPILWAAALLGTPLPGRVNGTDLATACARLSSEMGWSIAFVGGQYALTCRAAAQLQKNFPHARLHPYETPYPLTPEASRKITEKIHARGDKIILAALGAPKQEYWLQDHMVACGANVGIGIGSALDILSGDKPRAPGWMQRHGLEWLHRLRLEPTRLAKRYFVEDSPFFFYLLQERIRRTIKRR